MYDTNNTKNRDFKERCCLYFTFKEVVENLTKDVKSITQNILCFLTFLWFIKKGYSKLKNLKKALIPYRDTPDCSRKIGHFYVDEKSKIDEIQLSQRVVFFVFVFPE